MSETSEFPFQLKDNGPKNEPEIIFLESKLRSMLSDSLLLPDYIEGQIQKMIDDDNQLARIVPGTNVRNFDELKAEKKEKLIDAFVEYLWEQLSLIKDSIERNVLLLKKNEWITSYFDSYDILWQDELETSSWAIKLELDQLRLFLQWIIDELNWLINWSEWIKHEHLDRIIKDKLWKLARKEWISEILEESWITTIEADLDWTLSNSENLSLDRNNDLGHNSKWVFYRLNYYGKWNSIQH